MKKTILITSLLILLFSSSKAVDVVVRYDDYMLKPDTIQEKIVELFNKYNIPIVLGVIPCDEEESYVIVDGDYLSLLKELNNKGVVEIALHGLTHTLHNDGEFIGIPLAEQKRMLSKGKKILDSLFSQVVTFIPPWNKYDSNTLIALQQLGFKCISSCLTIGQPLENPYLQYYPHTVDNMTDFLKAIKDNKNRDCIIILMIHQYDFKEENSIHELDLLLSDLKQRSYVNFSTSLAF